TICFSPKPESTDDSAAHFKIVLEPREKKEITISLVITETPNLREAQSKWDYEPDHKEVKSSLHQSTEEWLGEHTEVQSDSIVLNRIIERSLLDLRVLRSNLREKEFFAAGVPWFSTLFGRDSIISALQTLPYEPGELAEQTLRLLASYQGKKMDDWRDEEPGKIMHELRVGELARTKEIPDTPYYGSIDSTMLLLILLGRYAAWTGDLGLFNDLRENVEQALQWMSNYGDLDGDGYIEYRW